MSEYKDFQIGQKVKVNAKYSLSMGNPYGTVVNIDPLGTSWPIEANMDDHVEWGSTPAPFDPTELDIVSEG